MGLTRSSPDLAPVVVSNGTGVPANGPPTTPPLARNSSMMAVLKSFASGIWRSTSIAPTRCRCIGSRVWVAHRIRDAPAPLRGAPRYPHGGATTMDYDTDDFSFEDLYDADDVYYRTCGKCGARTQPRWSESACLEEARRYGWRRVAASDRPGARRMDLCGVCADDAGLGPPLARFGW